MSVHRAPRLLVAVADPTLEARLLRHLKPLTGRIWTFASPPAGEQLDCIVTDDLAALDLATLCGGGAADVRPAILSLAASHVTDASQAAGQWVDARLPPAAKGRELRLACRLLTRVARLKRRASSHTHRHRRLARMASTDPLTGLPNRRAWNREVRRRLQELSAGAADRRLCLAILDLDRFKRLNDDFGHAAGDAALRAAARSLQSGNRQTDFVARLGGDEFGLLADVVEASAADRLVERVRRALQAAPSTAVVCVTASAGYAIAQAGADSQAIYAAADLALRRAKAAGRDTTRGLERNP